MAGVQSHYTMIKLMIDHLAITAKKDPRVVFALAALGVLAFWFTIYCYASLTSPSYTYKGKHVLVTGGSSGIGLELAKQYVRLGANVTIMARNVERLQAALADLKSVSSIPSQKLNSVSVDASISEEAVAASLKTSIAQCGTVDVIVNCAGTSVAGEFCEVPTIEFEKMFHTNVMSAVHATKAVLGGMKEKGGGRIVFVSSQAGQAAIHGYTAYATSKWALRGLAEALQMEVKPYGIYVSVSYPPDTDTPGYKVEMESKPRITQLLSEAGNVFDPIHVAQDITTGSAAGYFSISTGLDGWMLRQLHPGMNPVNHWWEAAQHVLFSSICRFIALFYVISWDRLIAHEVKNNPSSSSKSKGTTGVKDKKNK